jgi:hypothetical protein
MMVSCQVIVVSFVLLVRDRGVRKDGRMLFVLTGSSCSGKSTVAARCNGIDGVVVHDFDEIGVPSNADAAWRQTALETWTARAVDEERRGHDMLLTAQSPLGEILAVPSATRLEGIAVALIAVEAGIRSTRLEQRDPGKWNADAKHAFVNWARWHEAHADDPQTQPEVIMAGSSPEMDWSRWTSWTRDDPRWNTEHIDTTGRTIAQTADDVTGWIALTRHKLAQGRLPLARGWERR